MASLVPVYYYHLNRINFPDQWEFLENVTVSSAYYPIYLKRIRFFSNFDLNTMDEKDLKSLKLLDTTTELSGQNAEEEFKLFKRCVGVAYQEGSLKMPIVEIYEWCYMKEVQF